MSRRRKYLVWIHREIKRKKFFIQSIFQGAEIFLIAHRRVKKKKISDPWDFACVTLPVLYNTAKDRGKPYIVLLNKENIDDSSIVKIFLKVILKDYLEIVRKYKLKDFKKVIDEISDREDFRDALSRVYLDVTDAPKSIFRIALELGRLFNGVNLYIIPPKTTKTGIEKVEHIINITNEIMKRMSKHYEKSESRYLKFIKIIKEITGITLPYGSLLDIFDEIKKTYEIIGEEENIDFKEEYLRQLSKMFEAFKEFLKKSNSKLCELDEIKYIIYYSKFLGHATIEPVDNYQKVEIYRIEPAYKIDIVDLYFLAYCVYKYPKIGIKRGFFVDMTKELVKAYFLYLDKLINLPEKSLFLLFVNGEYDDCVKYLTKVLKKLKNEGKDYIRISYFENMIRQVENEGSDKKKFLEILISKEINSRLANYLTKMRGHSYNAQLIKKGGDGYFLSPLAEKLGMAIIYLYKKEINEGGSHIKERIFMPELALHALITLTPEKVKPY